MPPTRTRYRVLRKKAAWTMIDFMKLAASVAIGLFAGSLTSLYALTVPVAEDTSSSTIGGVRVITSTDGAAPILPVNARQSAFFRFDLANPNVVPAAITASNVKIAILQLYVVSTKAPAEATVTVHAVTTAWTESVIGKPVREPAINPTVLATLTAADLAKRNFITVTLTDAVTMALQNGVPLDIALETSDPTAKFVFASKEGPAIGEAPQLNLDADLGSSADLGPSITLTGNLVLPSTTTTTGILFAGSTPLLHDFGTQNFFGGLGAGNFTLSGAQNVAIGYHTLSADTTGGYNAAFGYEALSANTGGIYNTAAGYLSLAANTTGFPIPPPEPERSS